MGVIFRGPLLVHSNGSPVSLYKAPSMLAGRGGHLWSEMKGAPTGT